MPDHTEKEQAKGRERLKAKKKKGREVLKASKKA